MPEESRILALALVIQASKQQLSKYLFIQESISASCLLKHQFKLRTREAGTDLVHEGPKYEKKQLLAKG
jgi:hypothetical protein